MLSLIPILYILALACCLSILSKKSLCLTIPLTVLGTSLLVMIGGYIGDLRAGVYITLLIIPVSIIFVMKERRNIQIINKKELIIVILFLAVSMYYVWYHKNHSLALYDDFSHWGPMVKGMVKYNQLYCDLNINNNHPDYPPLIQCFEYLWCYLSGGFTSSSVFRAISVFSFSILLPFLKLLKEDFGKEYICKAIIFGVITILLPFVNYLGLFSFMYSIYIDSTIASVAAIAFLLSIFIDYDDKFECVVLSMFLTSLLLIKEIGIAFYLIDIFVILIINIKSNKKHLLKKSILFIFIPLLLLISWKIKTRNIVGQFNLGEVNILDALKVIFLNTGNQRSLFVKDSFVSALFTKPIITGIDEMNFMSLAIISLLVITILSFLIFNDKFKTIIISTTYLLGVIGYSLTMLFLYLTCFEEYESTRLASFDRYFGLYVYFSIVLIVLMLLIIKRKITSIISVFLMFLLVNSRIYDTYIPRGNVQEEDPKLQLMFEQIDSINPKTTDNIIIYHYDEITSVLKARFNYVDTPIRGISLFDLGKEKEYKTTEDLIKQYKKGITYVYLYSTGENFYEAWKNTNNDDLLNDRLYKVEDGILKLVPWPK